MSETAKFLKKGITFSTVKDGSPLAGILKDTQNNNNEDEVHKAVGTQIAVTKCPEGR